MKLMSVLRYITSHPLNKGRAIPAVFRFLWWQFICRINKGPSTFNFTLKSKLFIQKGMTGVTGNYYCGLHEFEDMSFVLHFLRPSDFFVDVGANVGSYTVLASAHVGASTLSVEPVPHTFSRLEKNIVLNKIEGKVVACNLALGSSKGQINFTQSLDTINHVATQGDEGIISVPVDTLDDLISGKEPILMKIDVEGFETEVLKGASKTLSSSELKAIIIELNGSGVRYGYDEAEVHRQLLAAGLTPHFYHPFTRTLEKVDSYGSMNTIYIRDVDMVRERIRVADKVRIFGKVY